MAISRTRKNFRIVLGVMLMLSISFFGTAAYFYMSVKQKRIPMRDIAPTLFYLDVYQHQARAYFSDREEKYKIAASLIQQGLFSPIYSNAGKIMAHDLADQGHAPAQTLHANILMRVYPHTKERKQKALSYYRLAAAQGYTPAVKALTILEKN